MRRAGFAYRQEYDQALQRSVCATCMIYWPLVFQGSCRLVITFYRSAVKVSAKLSKSLCSGHRSTSNVFLD